MLNNRRNLRWTKKCAVTSSILTYSPSFAFTASSTTSSHGGIRIVAPGSRLPGLTAADLGLLRAKQTRLVSRASSTLASLRAGPHIRNALEASLIFAQYE